MKFPKYSCSVCRKPSSRKWNLHRHINNCHAGIGYCVSNWDFPEDAYGLYWNRWKKGATTQKERSHYISPDLLKQFLPSNESNDTKPFDYYHLFTEDQHNLDSHFLFLGASFMQSPMGTYNPDPAANLQIFGFRGYVCDKCLTSETHYVAFPNTEGQGGIQAGHFCDPAKAAAASGLVDKFRVFRSLQDEIPTLIKQRVNSRNGNNNHLVAVRLSRPPEETIKFRNPDISKPPIAFSYSKERHLSLEAIESKKNVIT